MTLAATFTLRSSSFASRRKESKPRSDDHPLAQRAVGRPKIHRVVDTVAKVFGITPDDIRQGRGGAARLATAWLARYESLARLRPIAATLRLRSSGHVSDLVAECDRELERDPLLRELIDRCLALLRRIFTTNGVLGADTPLYRPALPVPHLIREAPPPYRAV